MLKRPFSREALVLYLALGMSNGGGVLLKLEIGVGGPWLLFVELEFARVSGRV